MEDNTGMSIFKPGGLNIENPLQNQEEAEELEDQKRRQEEIQNLLTVAMDDFNYDDSTINSSGNTSSAEESNLMQKYKNASYDDQLKVLYDVRVKEVKSLSAEIEKLKAEFSQQKDQFMKKLMLMEADKNQAEMSLGQSQHLLVTKTEEINKLRSELENLNANIAVLNADMQKLSQDNELTKHTNMDLIGQLNMMQKGFATSSVSEMQLREQHNIEMTQLKTSLESALSRLDRKESECKQIEQKLQEVSEDQNSIIHEKNSVINNLTEHLESAQEQCRDLIKSLEMISAENAKLKQTNVLDISNSLRTINEKQELMKSLQKELEKSQSMHNKHLAEFEKLQISYAELRKQHIQSSEEATSCKTQLKEILSEKTNMEKQMEHQNAELIKLRQEYDKSRFIDMEKRELERKVADLEAIVISLESKNTEEHAVQVSQFLNHSNISIAKEKEAREMLENELQAAYETVNKLKQELSESQEKIGLKLILEAEREKHIKALQEKAIQFEKVLKEKEAKPVMASTSTNTEKNVNEMELLKIKFDAELAEKEIQIRETLKSEYDKKLEDLRKEVLTASKSNSAENRHCNDCELLKSKLNQYEIMLTDQSKEVHSLKEQLNEDHNVVAEILDEWKEKFLILETQNQQLSIRYNEAKIHYDKLVLELRKRDDEEGKRFGMLKEGTEQAVKMWRKKKREELRNFVSNVNEVQSRIIQSSKKTEKELEAIEKHFRQNASQRQ